MSKLPTIPEFFSQKCILITGGTGFMGKVLIEKLLRSCPELKMIYIIVRSKKNNPAQERWQEIKESKVFDRLKIERPRIIDNKITVLSGDVKEKNLGLSKEDWHELEENVSIIFHCAASVRFNDPLTDAVFMNLRGSYELVRLALGMKNLKVLLHISTTYCNSFATESGEALYPVPADWRKTIEISEKLDPRTVAILSTKYLGSFPNTYTFTKNLTERMFWDHRDKLPIVIVRPSIVISSLNEPFPGWIDNLYGPIGLMLGAAKGVVRVSYADSRSIPDYMAVDVAIKALIVAAWKKGLSSKRGDIPIYNAASRTKGITNGEMMETALELTRKYPLNEVLWYPAHETTKSRLWYKYQTLIKHVLPAIFVDQIFKMTGKKPMLLETQIRIYNAMMALGYFSTKNWIFSTDNFLNLRNDILEEDKEHFNYNLDNVKAKDFMETGIKMGMQFLLNEDEKLLSDSRRKLKRLYWIDKIANISLKCFFGFAAYKYFF